MSYSRKQQETTASVHSSELGKASKGAVHSPPAYGVGAADGPLVQLKKKEEGDLKKKKPIQRKAKEEDLKKKKPLQRKAKEDDLKKKKTIQRKAQPGGSPLLIDAPDSPLEKEADAVADKVVQHFSALGSENTAPSHTSISRAPAAAGGTGALQAPPYMASELDASRGQGQSLPGHLRSEMEGVVGTDLSGVRIHTDAKAAALSEAVNAQAFTYGQDVYFNRGMYQPGTVEGRRLLGHEVGHVGQMQSLTSLSVLHKKTHATESDTTNISSIKFYDVPFENYQESKDYLFFESAILQMIKKSRINEYLPKNQIELIDILSSSNLRHTIFEKSINSSPKPDKLAIGIDVNRNDRNIYLDFFLLQKTDSQSYTKPIISEIKIEIPFKGWQRYITEKYYINYSHFVYDMIMIEFKVEKGIILPEYKNLGYKLITKSNFKKDVFSDLLGEKPTPPESITASIHLILDNYLEDSQISFWVANKSWESWQNSGK